MLSFRYWGAGLGPLVDPPPKSGPSATYVNKRNIPSVRQGKAYEDDVIPGGEAEADQESVDLHKGEFCVDVSTFGPVQYDITPVEVCDSTFSK